MMRVYARWIAVALNKEDAAQLLSEPHLDGLALDVCHKHGGWDESIFCVHPYDSPTLALSRF